jgi:hypothetical protein
MSRASAPRDAWSFPAVNVSLNVAMRLPKFDLHRTWLPVLRLCCVAAAVVVGGRAETAAPRPGVFERPLNAVPEAPLDRLVAARWEAARVQPALCSDAVFVRRVYLDMIGVLPTAAEARAFIQDPDTAGKRARLVDRLFGHPEFADYWAMKWGDLLRIKAEFPVNLWPNAAQAYHRWVRAALADNKPYDVFARELLTASGSNFRVGPANFFRAIQNRKPEGVAAAVALTFMGTRTDAWPEARLAGLAVFFSQIGYKPTSEWKEEHVFWDPLGASTVPGNTAPGRAAVTAIGTTVDPAPAGAKPPAASDSPRRATFPDGTAVDLPPDRDPREVFADWLITPENPWFTRNIANRVWAWLVGRGVIHEPDDLRPDNPPSNPELLAYLERELTASRYDLRHLYRLILNSRTYQLSSLPHGMAAPGGFTAYPLRRLDAEVLIDAINQITGTTDLYTSPIPEPYTYIPENMPAVAIADGSITSPFLALFGRSARATGMENERDNKPVPAQWLHLLNSSHIQRKLEQGPKLKAVFDNPKGQAAILEELYLTVLSRLPTPDEVKNAEGYGLVQTVKPPPAVKGAPPPKTPPTPKTVVVKRREDWIDLAWVLINSPEFLYRH